MRTQKSSKKRLKKLLKAKTKRRRLSRTANLERASNEAVIKFRKRAANVVYITHAAARQLASEVLRSTSRKFGYVKDTDEFRHMQSCLREAADKLTGHYRPEQYEI